jgi:diguanylate cyclase (GGDEF)-like protein
VLREFAARISRSVRATDMLMRWGGEEFLLVLRNTRQDPIESLAATGSSR